MQKRSTVDQGSRDRRTGRRRWRGLLWAAPIVAFAAAQLGCTIAINWAVVGISRTVSPDGGTGLGPREVLLPSGFWSETLLVPATGGWYGIEDMRARRWTTAEVEDGLSFLEGVGAGSNRSSSCLVWLALRNDSHSVLELALQEARLSGGRRIDGLEPYAVVTVLDGIGEGRFAQGSAANPEAYRELTDEWVELATRGQSRVEEWSVLTGSESDWGLVQVDPGAECYVVLGFGIGVHPQRLTLALPAREAGGEGRAYAYTLELRRGNRGRERNPKFMALTGQSKDAQQSEEAEEAE